MENNKKTLAAIFISAAIILSSGIVYLAARNFSGQGKYVEVKGLSEKIVKSDRAIWPINFDVKSNDSAELFKNINQNTNDVRDFLTKAGIDASEISVAPVDVYQDTYQGSLYRYNAHVSMSVYTDKVDLVRKLSQETLPLIEKGIILNGSYIQFEFSDVNSIKPEMLAEGIQNARSSAQKFAQDSGAKVGDISRANQGVFDITDKDPGSPEFKKIRLVTTVRYLLD